MGNDNNTYDSIAAGAQVALFNMYANDATMLTTKMSFI